MFIVYHKIFSNTLFHILKLIIILLINTCLFNKLIPLNVFTVYLSALFFFCDLFIRHNILVFNLCSHLCPHFISYLLIYLIYFN